MHAAEWQADGTLHGCATTRAASRTGRPTSRARSRSASPPTTRSSSASTRSGSATRRSPSALRSGSSAIPGVTVRDQGATQGAIVTFRSPAARRRRPAALAAERINVSITEAESARLDLDEPRHRRAGACVGALLQHRARRSTASSSWWRRDASRVDRSTSGPTTSRASPREFYYSRYDHPTGVAAERALGQLEGGDALALRVGHGRRHERAAHLRARRHAHRDRRRRVLRHEQALRDARGVRHRVRRVRPDRRRRPTPTSSGSRRLRTRR